MIVEIARTADADPAVPLPAYASAGAAGADLRANLRPADRARGLRLATLDRALVPTGLRLALPAGWEMQIRPRSGLALRHGLALVNAPGTIDADYRGELAILLVNLGREAVTIGHGDRIAQGVVAPAPQAAFALREELSETGRGAGGFGSTGRT